MVNKKYILIYLCLALIPIVMLAIEYPALPEMVAVRNNGMKPEDFENKAQLWLMPIINLIIATVALYLPKLEKRRSLNIDGSIAEKMFVAIICLFDGVFAIELLMAKGTLTMSSFGMVIFVILIVPTIMTIVLGVMQNKK